jgi:hypothetical protein
MVLSGQVFLRQATIETGNMGTKALQEKKMIALIIILEYWNYISILQCYSFEQCDFVLKHQ